MNKLYSVLGTGGYKEGRYHLDTFKSGKTSFAPLAILDILTGKDEFIDEMIVFATPMALKENGERLVDEHACRHSNVPLRFVTIVETLVQETMWEFFSQVYEEIAEGERVFFDITHGFRSFPLVTVAILYYARELKRIKIGGLFYGNYESRMEKQGFFEAPLDDLTDLINFLDWTQGIASFLESGDASRMIKLAETGGELQQGKPNLASENLAKSMQRFSQDLATCRSRSFPKHARELQKAIRQAGKKPEDYQKPLIGLLDKVEDKLAPFQGDLIMDDYFAVEWAIEHGQIQQACTMLYEHVITTLCYLVELDPNKQSSRQGVNRGVNVVRRKIPESRWNCSNKWQRDLVSKTVGMLQRYPELLVPLAELWDFRNSMNHAEAADKKLIRPIDFSCGVQEITGQLKPFFEEASGQLQMNLTRGQW